MFRLEKFKTSQLLQMFQDWRYVPSSDDILDYRKSSQRGKIETAWFTKILPCKYTIPWDEQNNLRRELLKEAYQPLHALLLQDVITSLEFQQVPEKLKVHCPEGFPMDDPSTWYVREKFYYFLEDRAITYREKALLENKLTLYRKMLEFHNKLKEDKHGKPIPFA